MPMADCPLDCSKPITSQAKFLIRNSSPSGGRSPNNSLRTVAPITQTALPVRCSALVKTRPSASCQLPTVK